MACTGRPTNQSEGFVLPQSTKADPCHSWIKPGVLVGNRTWPQDLTVAGQYRTCTGFPLAYWASGPQYTTTIGHDMCVGDYIGFQAHSQTGRTWVLAQIPGSGYLRDNGRSTLFGRRNM